MTRNELRTLSKQRVAEAEALSRLGHYPGAYYLAGYSIECALKACIAKKTKRHDFPDRKLAHSAWTHRLEDLVKVAELQSELDQATTANKALEANWAVVKDWTEDTRYDLNLSEQEAKKLVGSPDAPEERRPYLDKEAMVAMVLTDGQIEDGEKLLQSLDESKLKVNAALWFYFPDRENWKLVFSLPEVATEGPRAGYEKVQSVLSKVKDPLGIRLADIMLVRPKSDILGLLRSAIKTGPGISRIRFSKNVVNGQLIEDALIYRFV